MFKMGKSLIVFKGELSDLYFLIKFLICEVSSHMLSEGGVHDCMLEVQAFGGPEMGKTLLVN